MTAPTGNGPGGRPAAPRGIDESRDAMIDDPVMRRYFGDHRESKAMRARAEQAARALLEAEEGVDGFIALRRGGFTADEAVGQIALLQRAGVISDRLGAANPVELTEAVRQGGIDEAMTGLDRAFSDDGLVGEVFSDLRSATSKERNEVIVAADVMERSLVWAIHDHSLPVQGTPLGDATGRIDSIQLRDSVAGNIAAAIGGDPEGNPEVKISDETVVRLGSVAVNRGWLRVEEVGPSEIVIAQTGLDGLNAGELLDLVEKSRGDGFPVYEMDDAQRVAFGSLIPERVRRQRAAIAGTGFESDRLRPRRLGSDVEGAVAEQGEEVSPKPEQAVRGRSGAETLAFGPAAVDDPEETRRIDNEIISEQRAVDAASEADLVGRPSTDVDEPSTRSLTDTRTDAQVITEMKDTQKRVMADYRRQLHANNVFAGKNARLSPDERMDEVNKEHDAMTGMMVVSVIGPLDRGINTQTVLAATTTAVAMWCMSPEFRDMTTQYTDQLTKGLRDRVDAVKSSIRGKRMWDSVAKREEAAERADAVETSFRNRLSAIESTEGRVPMSYVSAADTLATTSEMAYTAMRTEGTPDVTMGQYRELVSGLEKQWAADGLEVSKVHAYARDLVGERAQTDPTYHAMFSELAGGRVRMTPQRMNEHTGTMGWDKRWQFPNGAKLSDTKSTFFNPRPPAPAEDHVGALGAAYAIDLTEAFNERGPEAAAQVILGYQNAPQLHGSGLSAAESSSPGSQPDVALAAQMRASVALQAALDDGHDPAMCSQIHAHALGEGFAAFAMDNPKAAEAIRSAYEPKMAVMSQQYREERLKETKVRSIPRPGPQFIQREELPIGDGGEVRAVEGGPEGKSSKDDHQRGSGSTQPISTGSSKESTKPATSTVGRNGRPEGGIERKEPVKKEPDKGDFGSKQPGSLDSDKHAGNTKIEKKNPGDFMAGKRDRPAQGQTGEASDGWGVAPDSPEAVSATSRFGDVEGLNPDGTINVGAGAQSERRRRERVVAQRNERARAREAAANAARARQDGRGTASDAGDDVQQGLDHEVAETSGNREKGTPTWRADSQRKVASSAPMVPKLPEARVQTPGQRQQAEGFNRGYDANRTSVQSKIETSYDNKATEGMVEEGRYSNSGAGFALKEGRVRRNQAANAEDRVSAQMAQIREKAERQVRDAEKKKAQASPEL